MIGQCQDSKISKSLPLTYVLIAEVSLPLGEAKAGVVALKGGVMDRGRGTAGVPRRFHDLV